MTEPGSLNPIGIVSGTGPAGAALAARLVAAGLAVVVGSRDRARAVETIDEFCTRAADPERSRRLATAGTNTDAAGCDMVVLATNADHVLAVVEALKSDLGDKIVVTMAARVKRSQGRGFEPDPPPSGSIATELASTVPQARVVAALQHVPAKALGDLESEYHGDVLVCGDDPDAVQSVIDCFDRVGLGTLFDAGCLANAAAVEATTAVLLSLNIRYKDRFSVRLVSARGENG